MSKIYIIGIGGVGSFLSDSINRLMRGKYEIVLVDGDRLEEKNLDRQLFSKEEIGMYKAEAMAKRLGCQHIDEYFAHGGIELTADDVLLVCVDNMTARKAALSSADMYGCQAFFAANEVHSAEAYYYRPEWSGKRLDPRSYYPEILRDTSGDPRALAMGCTGVAQENNRQLVSANFMAAALLQHLFVFWVMEATKLMEEGLDGILPNLPYQYRAGLTGLETILVGGQPI